MKATTSHEVEAGKSSRPRSRILANPDPGALCKTSALRTSTSKEQQLAQLSQRIAVTMAHM